MNSFYICAFICLIFFTFYSFFYLLNLLGGVLVSKRCQVYVSITLHLFIALCVHHPVIIVLEQISRRRAYTSLFWHICLDFFLEGLVYDVHMNCMQIHWVLSIWILSCFLVVTICMHFFDGYSVWASFHVFGLLYFFLHEILFMSFSHFPIGSYFYWILKLC